MLLIDIPGTMEILGVLGQNKECLANEGGLWCPRVRHVVHLVHGSSALVAEDLKLWHCKAFPAGGNLFISPLLESLSVALLRSLSQQSLGLLLSPHDALDSAHGPNHQQRGLDWPAQPIVAAQASRTRCRWERHFEVIQNQIDLCIRSSHLDLQCHLVCYDAPERIANNEYRRPHMSHHVLEQPAVVQSRKCRNRVTPRCLVVIRQGARVARRQQRCDGGIRRTNGKDVAINAVHHVETGSISFAQGHQAGYVRHRWRLWHLVPQSAHKGQDAAGRFGSQGRLQNAVVSSQRIHDLHRAAILQIDVLSAVEVLGVWRQDEQCLALEDIGRRPGVRDFVEALHVPASLVAEELELLSAEALPAGSDLVVGKVLEGRDIAFVGGLLQEYLRLVRGPLDTIEAPHGSRHQQRGLDFAAEPLVATEASDAGRRWVRHLEVH
mmetsp:Transcript_80976/g.205783  ORF Transcript_80976/g.205783 Transcript_80976/m.205783 type:complete len:437 (+) Transcript_80976:130-1440(+)